MKNITTLFIPTFILFITSCISYEEPTVINEEELITTIELELTNTADATDIILFKSLDADGDGPNDPMITVTGTINANTIYDGVIRFLNESIAPSENITEEVIEEADEHEVFYIATLTDVSIAKTDLDSNGNPLGVITTFETGAIGTGTLTIVLRHEPLKPNDNSLSGAGGETDAEVSFMMNVQ